MSTLRPWTTAALVLAVGLAACGKKEADKAEANASSDARTVTVTRVELRSLGSGLTASGRLIPREEAAVGSELSGYRVARVLVEEGAVVRAGQPLAQLDDTLLRAQVDQQAAVTAQAEAEARRVAGLDGQGVLSQEQIETRRYTAKAQQAALKELRTRSERMTITAPVGGVVLERTVRPGDVSGGGTTPWFRIARDQLIELDAELNEADLSKLNVGSPVTVTLPAGTQVQGTVRLISPQINAQTQLGRVRVRLPVRADLRAGGFARAVFGGGGREVLAVPETAVRYDAEGASVATVGADNKVKQVPVKTGQRGGGFVELVQGPPAGARVLLGAAAFALDGDVVRPVEGAAGAPNQKATR
ncbi:efflux RND transporter periplasmic adaptor subunit [Caulobacter sp. NIBR2454]|uniref:efflux RND transporter periplasmic adaptor subunit n=1 Tax=Caulobacter sp. NIBR2454 TaxID=3015996 RepID=UPI0022B5F9C6|nr:efflux RND transporter periplasmic adaptor subunit [Caulobacter sp. NIBR2454]